MVGDLRQLITSTKPDLNKLPGGWEPHPEFVPSITGGSAHINPIALNTDERSAFVLENVLTDDDCKKLIHLMDLSPNFESVSVQGRKDVPDYRRGSTRTSIWAPDLAIKLWAKIAENFTGIRMMTPFTPTDWWQGDKSRLRWKAIGVTPLCRFMRYQQGGQHFSHYDAAFIYPNDRIRTLQSMVIYLTSCPNDGATRFIKDGQNDKPVWDRTHDDWLREVEPGEVIARIQPKAGSALVFDHRFCHDVEKYTGNEPRIIIRADILYEAES